MRRARLALAAIACLLTAGPASAQFGPNLQDSTVVEELVVRAYGGPPWWTVSDKDSKVYILAAPDELPPGVDFDRRLLERRMVGAKQLILPPRIALGIGALPAVFRVRGLGKRLYGAETEMEAQLPPAVRARFVAHRTRLGVPATRYGGLSPGLAGLVLAGDAQRLAQAKAKAPSGKSVAAIAADMARARKVKLTPASTYGGALLSGFMADLNRPGLPCLVSVLDRLDRPLRDTGQRPQIVQAWAEGDVRPLLEAARAGDEAAAFLNFQGKDDKVISLGIATRACKDAMPSVLKVERAYLPDQANAVARALAKPGHSVAVLDAGSLLVTGGVLDQLRLRGFTIATPDQN